MAANADRMLLLLDGKKKPSDIRTAWGLDDVQGGEEGKIEEEKFDPFASYVVPK